MLKNRGHLLFLLLILLPLAALPQHDHCRQSKSFNYQNESARLADERLTKYDLKHVFLDLNADNTSTFISGTALLHMEITEETSVIVLELSQAFTISSVQVNGVSESYVHNDELIVIELGQTYAPGANLTCNVRYSGAPNPQSGIFSGINNAISNAWGNQVTWTLSEPFNAKMWWPAKQVLTDKIDSVWVFVTTDDHLKVGSNGLLTNTVPLDHNKVRYEWKSGYPIAYYLISITIAEYVEYNNYAKPTALQNDSILIQNYIYNNPETLPYYQDELDDIPEMVELFSDYYGLYPFYKEKYGHAMAPFSGGMEHQTMSSMGIFTFSLDAHELAHQWFGDLVTCASWQDIWINEGFARFSEYLAVEKILSTSNGRKYRIDDMKVVTGSPGGSVFVPEESANDENRIFNSRLTYMKGGLIIHMIRRILNNDELFFHVLRSYLEQFAHKTATGEDFKRVLETETGMKFDDFFDQWYYGEGYPIYNITWQLQGDSIELSIDQSTSASVSLFTAPLEFIIEYDDDTEDTVRLVQTQNQQIFHIPIAGEVNRLEFDPDEWLIKKVGRFVQVDEGGNTLDVDEGQDLLMYPNPASGMLKFSKKISDLSIQDTSGKTILSQPSAQQINVKSWKTGIYFATFQLNGQFFTKKILKK